MIAIEYGCLAPSTPVLYSPWPILPDLYGSLAFGMYAIVVGIGTGRIILYSSFEENIGENLRILHEIFYRLWSPYSFLAISCALLC